MNVKVFKRADCSRSLSYQDELLEVVVPNWPKVPTFTGKDEIPDMLRPTKRSTEDDIFTASIALVGDTEKEVRQVVKMLNDRGAQIRDVEVGEIWGASIAAGRFVKAWKEARRVGAAMRGAKTSAANRKAATAKALAVIEHELKSTDIPSKILLARVGLKSIANIKNHYGINRETMQSRYQAELKRAKRRQEAGRV